MLKIRKILGGLIKSSNEKELEKLKFYVNKINELEPHYKKFSLDQFSIKTAELRSKLEKKIELDDLLPDAFACVREAAKRTLGERHFDVQLLGGIVLHQGKIAEMKTGEGKTLVSTLPTYLNSLSQNGVHIVTVNDYLAKRDAEWMGKIYKLLGLSVGCISNELDDVERKKNYNCDITYGTNNELGFDYLRDNMKHSIDEMVQRQHNFCIVDEVDSILIDESRTPLIISGAVEDKSDKYFVSDKITKLFKKEDYNLDEKNKSAILTDIGIDRIEKYFKSIGVLKNNNFYDPENISLVHHINQALRANFLFSKDKDYIIRDNKIQIIDEFTGRVLEGRRFSEGLHQALEAKENVEIQSENQTLASITYQNYFRLYKKLSGMTGTAMTEAEEFYDIYKLNTISIPTNTQMVRKDLNDQIFRTETEKNKAIIEKIEENHKTGQPILVGTTSIEKSEKISEMLKEKKIKHNVLNAKQHETEAKIIEDAGKLNVVTIATNMAGRGTDIQLGGKFLNTSKDFKDKNNFEKNKTTYKKEHDAIIKLGGLLVIGTERHESRRIDNQLRGRSGRQGDPGSSIFYISLQDDLMRIFGSESIDTMLKKLGMKEGESIDHPWINKALERAQQKVEARNFDIRKSLLQFDDVMNDQRHVIFNQRNSVISKNNVDEIIELFIDEVVGKLNLQRAEAIKENSLEKFKVSIKNFTGRALEKDEDFQKILKDEKKFVIFLKEIIINKRKDRIKKISAESNLELEKRIFLQTLDYLWRSHLQYLEELRQVIGLRSYGQKDPLVEFKKESFSLFKNLLEKLKYDLVLFLNNISVVEKDAENEPEKIKTFSSPLKEHKPKCLLHSNKVGKISRNEKCPETGKKFKNCCGAF